MELNIVYNENLVANPIKFLRDNFVLEEEEQKLYLRFDIDRTKQFRIFFKNVFLTDEQRHHIKTCWETGEGLADLFEKMWIVKSTSSGVLLFVPEETEKSDKSGVFVLIIGKNFLYPNSMYFKRSYVNSQAISLFYVLPKSLVFLLGQDSVNILVNTNNVVSMKKYKEISAES